MRQWNLRSDEQGSASVVAAFMVAVLLIVTIAGVHVGGAVVGRHRAQAVADLAALAAAWALPAGPEAACGQAGYIAARMRATLVDCDIEGLDVVVRAEVAVAVGVARAAARAGPER